MDPYDATSVDTESERLVESWVRHAALRGNGDFWAWDRVNDLVESDPERGWDLVQALVEVAPDDLLGSVAAGPLERLVVLHAKKVIDRIEARARADERFRECLAQIWIGRDAVPAAIERRLQHATGDRILVIDDEESF